MKNGRLVVTFILVVLMVAAAAPTCAQAAELIPVYTPPSGGTVYILGTGVTSVTNKFLPGATFVHEPTTGTMDMIRRMQRRAGENKAAFGMFGSPDGNAAYHGKGDYAGKQFDALRAVCFVDASDQYLVVPANSPIKSYADVKGKRIGVGGPGSTLANNAFFFFEQHGVTRNDFKYYFYSYKENVEGIQNGSIDGAVLGGAYPMAAYTELSMQHNVRIVPVEDRIFEKIGADHPYYFRRTIPAGAYKGHDQDTQIFAFTTFIWAHAGMSDELVYSFLKNLYEHRTDYYQVHKSAEKNFVFENLAKGLPIPLHPGAEKYLKEIGAVK